MNKLEELQKSGFTIIEDIFSDAEINKILSIINSADHSRSTFRKSNDLFAIREFLQEIPEVAQYIFTGKLKEKIVRLIGNNYFVVKSIYFDKPEKSNWFVSYHQDLTISVDKKTEAEGYDLWTVKNDRFAVQPPIPVLESIYTLRIHLDETDENNGALKVIPGSHTKGIYRPETIDWTKETEITCAVSKGGMMVMRPLLLHSSGRSVNNNQRRVIHIELSNTHLTQGLKWAEKAEI